MQVCCFDIPFLQRKNLVITHSSYCTHSSFSAWGSKTNQQEQYQSEIINGVESFADFVSEWFHFLKHRAGVVKTWPKSKRGLRFILVGLVVQDLPPDPSSTPLPQYGVVNYRINQFFVFFFHRVVTLSFQPCLYSTNPLLLPHIFLWIFLRPVDVSLEAYGPLLS